MLLLCSMKYLPSHTQSTSRVERETAAGNFSHGRKVRVLGTLPFPCPVACNRFFFSFFFRGKGKRRRMSHGIPFNFCVFYYSTYTRLGRKKSLDDKKRLFTGFGRRPFSLSSQRESRILLLLRTSVAFLLLCLLVIKIFRGKKYRAHKFLSPGIRGKPWVKKVFNILGFQDTFFRIKQRIKLRPFVVGSLKSRKRRRRRRRKDLWLLQTGRFSLFLPCPLFSSSVSPVSFYFLLFLLFLPWMPGIRRPIITHIRSSLAFSPPLSHPHFVPQRSRNFLSVRAQYTSFLLTENVLYNFVQSDSLRFPQYCTF